MDLAAAAAGEWQRAEADQRQVAARFIEIAPETERGHVTDADHAVEVAASDHPLAGSDDEMCERGILAQARKRLGVNRCIQREREVADARAVERSEAAEENQR